MKVNVLKEAEKQCSKLPQNAQKKILKAIELLQKYPYAGKKLKGKLQSYYSYTIYPYRIVYKIDATIIVLTIAHRQGVYK